MSWRTGTKGWQEFKAHSWWQPTASLLKAGCVSAVKQERVDAERAKPEAPAGCLWVGHAERGNPSGRFAADHRESTVFPGPT